MPAEPAAPAKPTFQAASLRRILRLARPELRSLMVATVFLALGSGASLVFPQGIRFIIDQTIPLDRAAGLLVGAAAIQAVSTSLRFAIFTIAGERVVARLRSDLFARLMDQEIAFFDENKTGELSSRLASDTTVLQNTVSVNISMALRFAASVIGGVGFLFYTSTRLTLLMLAIVPPIALGAFSYGRKVRKLSRDAQDALARASEVAVETLAGIRTVRAFAAEPHEVKRYSEAVDRGFDLARRRTTIGATFMGIASFAGYSAIAVVLWYGGKLVGGGDLTSGKLASFLIYTILVAASMGGLSELWTDFMKASGSAERVFALLDREPAIPRDKGARLDRVEGRVEFDRVVFAYPTRKDARVLTGLDLSIRPGEAVALVGPSGAGKSTIAAMLTRLYDPDGGRVLIDGRDLRELAPDGLRRQIGVVAQEPILFSSSIADNIRYGREGATDAEIEAAARAANAHDFISKFPEGYATLVGERGVQLSGGQKQRVAIARAVLKDPRILILDEATSALDAESEHLVQEALDRLMKGRTTLIIAHRLSTVMHADRVCVIDGGGIAQSGKHAVLMAEEGIYKRLVERQLATA